MSDRGHRTRESLIAAAELLWAARGFDAVSVREITAAAGQRNNNALHYHFGSKEALFQTIARRHLDVLNERTEKLYARMRDESAFGVRDQVAMLVRPTAEYVGEGPSARAWIRIAARVAGAPRQSDQDTASVVSPAAIEVGSRLVERLGFDLGFQLAVDRVRIASEAFFHALADRARLEDDPARTRSMMPLPVFVELVIDMVTSAVTAPASDALLRAIKADVPPGARSLHE